MNSTALSCDVVTPFAEQLTASSTDAISEAQAVSDANGAPVGIWLREGWYTVCEVPPEMIEPDPELAGWILWAVVDPSDQES